MAFLSQLALTWGEPILYISFQLCVQWYHVGSWKWATKGVLTPRKLSKSTNPSFYLHTIVLSSSILNEWSSADWGIPFPLSRSAFRLTILATHLYSSATPACLCLKLSLPSWCFQHFPSPTVCTSELLTLLGFVVVVAARLYSLYLQLEREGAESRHCLGASAMTVTMTDTGGSTGGLNGEERDLKGILR